MTKEEFFEKLLRLTWDNGYEYLRGADDICVERFPTELGGDYVVRFFGEEITPEGESLPRSDMTVNIERFLIDHDFVRVLCELRWKPKSFKEARIKEEWVMGNLAHSQDRTSFLKQTFSDLVEGE